MSKENMEAENADSDEGWVRIGNLKGIYIYPLDTGPGFKISKAFCTMDGLQSCSLKKRKKKADVDNTRYFDRTFVPIKPYNGELLIHSSVADMDNVEQFQKMQKKANEIISGTWQPWRTKFTYMEEKMIANDIGFNITYPNLGYLGEINFIPQEQRNEFISQARSKFEINDSRKFLSNFYAYTMVNITSLDVLQEKNEDCEKIPIEEFRPHFVIETNEENLLDRIVELRIGDNVRFSNIVPCTHRFDEKNTTEEKKDLRDIMKTYRTLNWLYPELYKSKMPAFGINLDIIKPGKISLYDDILVKFEKQEVKVFKIQ